MPFTPRHLVDAIYVTSTVPSHLYPVKSSTSFTPRQRYTQFKLFNNATRFTLIQKCHAICTPSSTDIFPRKWLTLEASPHFNGSTTPVTVVEQSHAEKYHQHFYDRPNRWNLQHGRAGDRPSATVPQPRMSNPLLPAVYVPSSKVHALSLIHI